MEFDDGLTAEILVMLSKTPARDKVSNYFVLCPVCKKKVYTSQPFHYDIVTPPECLDVLLRKVLFQHSSEHPGEPVWNAVPNQHVQTSWSTKDYVNFLAYKALRASAAKEHMKCAVGMDDDLDRIGLTYFGGRRLPIAKIWLQLNANSVLQCANFDRAKQKVIVARAKQILENIDKAIATLSKDSLLNAGDVERTFNRYQLLFFMIGAPQAFLEVC